MHNNQKIGLGIVTCNRRNMFAQLLRQSKELSSLDELRIVKNKQFDYGADDPMLTNPCISTCIAEDVGVGVCKNMLIKQLLEAQCQHIFIVEDDVKIKNLDVLSIYIDTAAAFNLEHMNFCCTYSKSIPKKLATPVVCFQHENYAIDIYRRLSGVFEYFTSNSIVHVGLMDEHYVNALEHCEHTYRLAKAGFTVPFYAFADVHESWKLLEDQGTQTTIQPIYSNLISAANLFKQQHGVFLKDVPIPSLQEVAKYLSYKQLAKNQKH